LTNKEAHEEAAGMNLDNLFFELNGIDPNAEFIEDSPGTKTISSQKDL
jgi:hypothetical protein